MDGLSPKLVLRAVEGVTLDIPKGSFFGLVGESGSGKTTLGRAFLKANKISGGSVHYADGDVEYDLESMNKVELKDYRKRAQLIFQDPYAALSPRMTVRDIIAEPLEVMGLTQSREETDARVREIAAKCRLNVEHLRRFPHAFSGGQRQRISIARALVGEPALSWWPTRASPPSTSRSRPTYPEPAEGAAAMTWGSHYLFISHDLSVVAHTCDHVAVMYLGRLVETAPTRQLFFTGPRHPYTKALLSAIPSLDPGSIAARRRSWKARSRRRPIRRRAASSTHDVRSPSTSAGGRSRSWSIPGSSMTSPATVGRN